MPDFDFDIANIIKVMAVVLSTVFTIIVIVGALIQMVFSVFFSLTFTIIYLDNWQIEEEAQIQLQEGDVL